MPGAIEILTLFPVLMMVIKLWRNIASSLTLVEREPVLYGKQILLRHKYSALEAPLVPGTIHLSENDVTFLRI